MIRAGILLLSLLAFGLQGPTETLVHNVAEFKEAVSRARPGDTIVLANGTWTDADLVFDADGVEGDSITVRAETPGRVILNGNSTLRIGGSYLKVEGLWFHRGALERGHVIAFRTDRPAHHSRLTETAVTEYNPANWLVQYKWISLYGTHNRVDHCYIAGKTHDGATLVVWLEDPPNDAPNYHRIDHNTFGPRPPLGKNGGETIRIGTSHRSMQDSHTVVEYNLFDRTDGEHEIISNKSGRNTYRGNTFSGARGALTLRHGNAALVTGNYFFGYGNGGTGGVRIIGEDHQVTDNYFEQLGGDSSRAALSIMNGIPDSPLNRYFQVKRAVVANNTWKDARVAILYGLGADTEKSLEPEGVLFRDNVILEDGYASTIVANIPMDPITWEGNVFFGVSMDERPANGILWEDPKLEEGADDLWRPSVDGPARGKGASLRVPPVADHKVRPAWWWHRWHPAILADSTRSLPDFSWAGYRWGEEGLPEYTPTIDVTDYGVIGTDTRDDTEAFQRALAAAHAEPGLVVLGIPAGQYHLNGVLRIERDSLIIQGAGSDATIINIEKPLSILDTPPLPPAEEACEVQGLPCSPFTYAGGMFWVERTAAANVEPSIEVVSLDTHFVSTAAPVDWTPPVEAQLSWEGEDGRLIQDVTLVRGGGTAWYTREAIWKQGRAGTRVMLTRHSPLREVGIEGMTIHFESVPFRGYQLEDGYNAIYMKGVRHGWVWDVAVLNGDAGAILHASSNVTMSYFTTGGRKGGAGIYLAGTRSALIFYAQLRAVITSIGCANGGGYNVVTSGSTGFLYDAGCTLPNLYESISLQASEEPFWDMAPNAAPVFWSISGYLTRTVRLPAFVGSLGNQALVVGLDFYVPVRLALAPGTHVEGVNQSWSTVQSLYNAQIRARLGKWPPAPGRAPVIDDPVPLRGERVIR